MLGIRLRSVLVVRKQADNAADSVPCEGLRPDLSLPAIMKKGYGNFTKIVGIAKSRLPTGRTM